MVCTVEGPRHQWDDNDKKIGVVIINETIARKLWPGQDPIGQIANVIGMDARVIGVVADVHESSVEGKPGWQMYLPGVSPQFSPDGAQLVVRAKVASGNPCFQRDEYYSANQSRTAGNGIPAHPAVGGSCGFAAPFLRLVGGHFCRVGIDFGFVGIYGVISYSVTQRTQEIGIRMALGATQGRVQMAVIGKTLLLALIGIATGTLASFAISSLISSLLFGTRATDQATFLSMILLLLLVALLAGYIPARRASRINPMVALRNN